MKFDKETDLSQFLIISPKGPLSLGSQTYFIFDEKLSKYVYVNYYEEIGNF